MKASSPRVPEEVAGLVEKLGRRLQGRANDRGLKPAQWTALRFLARAMPSERTVTAFAAFNATTVSSASQTIRLLARKGLVQIQPLPRDARVKALELTSPARRLLAGDPLLVLTQAIAEIEPDQAAGFAAIVEALIRAL